ncbi:MurR/RpiR family transcriptional regulator [Marinobacter lutaoensis]|jgi:RpiR family carbohydrate utilization transcriptional regulator|uniref:Transcriptional regulator HexR n=1 Tax=Marinobacter lutaoensis TaxID=135739 RepID=A0A1V2DX90_9GAMM|nr:MurR/RpiR family transcriptional regulator [Marinobacter lutaoensis]MBE03401.1 MurR/RpiR family transcriptional regulator [Marinobacter sp.]MBI42612.1 MurR/RpiR family transcriptional regulator [Oceanospirillales bacterium]NVD35331.1 MurR/RpiR family transcriptional regulator [Marinobacter lutaoensis]ONF45278.1 transcriptional regulator HexR [Marinobacter lutaoensis]|tara:strand:- start:6364 stop:7236 length:873 start_codon:yes stop_codon:yes gene_type:complete
MASHQAQRDDNLLEDIQARLESLNKSERKVAEAILRDPSAATRYSIAALARAANVSEPTVNRFCRGFSATGFPDFKIRLAQSIATGTPYVGQNIEPDDSVEEFADKVILRTIASLDKARQSLDHKALATAIDYLIQAKQIAFFGMGGSASVAMDAQHKFFRFNIPVMFYDDALMQRMVAAGAQVGDVIVVISYTGRTKESVDIAQVARANGATVIGITNPDSPLAECCTVVLGVTAPEDTEVYMPMSSRIIHLSVIDVLATGVTLKRGHDFLGHLKKIKESLKATRFPPN